MFQKIFSRIVALLILALESIPGLMGLMFFGLLTSVWVLICWSGYEDGTASNWVTGFAMSAIIGPYLSMLVSSFSEAVDGAKKALAVS